jgi:hypothetical protein
MWSELFRPFDMDSITVYPYVRDPEGSQPQLMILHNKKGCGRVSWLIIGNFCYMAMASEQAYDVFNHVQM